MIDFYKNTIYRADLAQTIDQTIGFSSLRNKSVLITGATGLIGSFLADTLMYANETLDAHIHVYAVGRNMQRLLNRFSSFKDTTWFHPIEQDVNEPLAFDFKVDYVIHAASNAYPAAFETNPVETILSNISGTRRLLEYAHTIRATCFLFISSGEVYGENQEDALSEDFSGYVNPMSVRSCYPTAKRTAENLCVAYTHQYGLHTVVARLCHTYGPNVTSFDNRASVQFINQALKGENIVLKSRGTQRRSYCYVADSAAGILSILLKGEKARAYNVANPSSIVTVAGLAEEIARQAHVKVVYQNLEKKDFETLITHAVLDAQKLESLGWSGRYCLPEGIEHTLKILKEKKKREF